MNATLWEVEELGRKAGQATFARLLALDTAYGGDADELQIARTTNNALDATRQFLDALDRMDKRTRRRHEGRLRDLAFPWLQAKAERVERDRRASLGGPR